MTNRSRDWLEALPREVERLHGLGDRWLGEALLRLCRSVRSAVPELSSGPVSLDGTNGFLLWDVVPELGRRLGCTLIPGESQDSALRDADGPSLRTIVSDALHGASLSGLASARTDGPVDPVDLLTRPVANGSPVALALDRVAPPTPSDQDRCARQVRDASRRRNHVETSAWSPSLQSWRPAPIDPLPSDEDAAPPLPP